MIIDLIGTDDADSCYLLGMINDWRMSISKIKRNYVCITETLNVDKKLSLYDCQIFESCHYQRYMLITDDRDEFFGRKVC